MACKERATVIRSRQKNRCDEKTNEGERSTRLIPQNYACGYQQRWNHDSTSTTTTGSLSTTPQQHSVSSDISNSPRDCKISSTDHDILIHFHAHQMHRIIGPNAIYPELRRTTNALSTAVMLFRRFYLSNSVIDFPPRAMAAASAILAVKVDCEPNLPVSSQSPPPFYCTLSAVCWVQLVDFRRYRLPVIFELYPTSPWVATKNFPTLLEKTFFDSLIGSVGTKF